MVSWWKIDQITGHWDLWGISGHELDEIIHEILTNPKFKWNGENGIASFLGLNVQPMKGTNWTWTKRKIQFANIAAETPYRDSAIFKIAGRHAERRWQYDLCRRCCRRRPCRRCSCWLRWLRCRLRRRGCHCSCCRCWIGCHHCRGILHRFGKVSVYAGGWWAGIIAPPASAVWVLHACYTAWHSKFERSFM